MVRNLNTTHNQLYRLMRGKDGVVRPTKARLRELGGSTDPDAGSRRGCWVWGGGGRVLAGGGVTGAGDLALAGTRARATGKPEMSTRRPRRRPRPARDRGRERERAPHGSADGDGERERAVISAASHWAVEQNWSWREKEEQDMRRSTTHKTNQEYLCIDNGTGLHSRGTGPDQGWSTCHGLGWESGQLLNPRYPMLNTPARDSLRLFFNRKTQF